VAPARRIATVVEKKVSSYLEKTNISFMGQKSGKRQQKARGEKEKDTTLFREEKY